MKRTTTSISRRGLLGLAGAGLAGAAAATLLPAEVRASGAPLPPRKPAPWRKLNLLNTHTGEHLDLVYWRDGNYLPEALRDANYFLRDFRANEVRAMDPELLDLVSHLGDSLCCNQPIQMISGYRNAKTNAMLRARNGGGVARNSYHIKGQAMDIHMPDVALSRLRDAALSMRVGGVGFYPRSQFVHVDTGPVRRWNG